MPLAKRDPNPGWMPDWLKPLLNEAALSPVAAGARAWVPAAKQIPAMESILSGFLAKFKPHITPEIQEFVDVLAEHPKITSHLAELVHRPDTDYNAAVGLTKGWDLKLAANQLLNRAGVWAGPAGSPLRMKVTAGVSRPGQSPAKTARHELNHVAQFIQDPLRLVQGMGTHPTPAAYLQEPVEILARTAEGKGLPYMPRLIREMLVARKAGGLEPWVAQDLLSRPALGQSSHRGLIDRIPRMTPDQATEWLNVINQELRRF